ncbi:CLUMA_CG005983, isoform A [Clunio marinus]|uniref:CLUMA_CG005983, isoform A n=1 Tax=Clunio marinus TaxID=568069 RepID=A0A1J1I226_9DIPT|nr:CLUMA_CG005983, isoform A [Clunio marinus]
MRNMSFEKCAFYDFSIALRTVSHEISKVTISVAVGKRTRILLISNDLQISMNFPNSELIIIVDGLLQGLFDLDVIAIAITNEKCSKFKCHEFLGAGSSKAFRIQNIPNKFAKIHHLLRKLLNL